MHKYFTGVPGRFYFYLGGQVKFSLRMCSLTIYLFLANNQILLLPDS